MEKEVQQRKDIKQSNVRKWDLYEKYVSEESKKHFNRNPMTNTYVSKDK